MHVLIPVPVCWEAGGFHCSHLCCIAGIYPCCFDFSQETASRLDARPAARVWPQSGRAVGTPVITAPGVRTLLAVRADTNNVLKFGHKISSHRYSEDPSLPLNFSIEQRPRFFPGLQHVSSSVNTPTVQMFQAACSTSSHGHARATPKQTPRRCPTVVDVSRLSS